MRLVFVVSAPEWGADEIVALLLSNGMAGYLVGEWKKDEPFPRPAWLEVKPALEPAPVDPRVARSEMKGHRSVRLG